MLRRTSTPEIERLAEMVGGRLGNAAPGSVHAAVSGGADSCALLLALAELHRTDRLGGRPLEVLHVDHGVRIGSGRDARAVARLAFELGVPCRVLRLTDLTERASEDRMRRARYDAFEALLGAGRSETALLVTAHHADDDAETLLFRVRRGAGDLRGLAGIRADRPLRPGSGVRVIRPLLRASRAELVDVCRSVAWPAAVDPSNADVGRARNWIRHAVLPALRQREDEADRLLAQALDIARQTSDRLDARARAWLDRRTAPEPLAGGASWVRLTPEDDPAVRNRGLAMHDRRMRDGGGAATSARTRRLASLADGPIGRRLEERGRLLRVERTRVGLLWTHGGSVASAVTPLHTLRPGAATPPCPPPAS